jgi:hypothetical protein
MDFHELFFRRVPRRTGALAALLTPVQGAGQ